MLEKADPKFLEQQRRWEYALQIQELPHPLPNNDKHWSWQEMVLLCDMWMIGMTAEEIGNLFRQNPSAIRMRLTRLGLINDEGNELLERRDFRSNGLKWHLHPRDRTMMAVPEGARLD
ncbi:MAG: hypothetical protein Tsb0013_07420 [Phycisphaerales bacterium]